MKFLTEYGFRYWANHFKIPVIPSSIKTTWTLQNTARIIVLLSQTVRTAFTLLHGVSVKVQTIFFKNSHYWQPFCFLGKDWNSALQ